MNINDNLLIKVILSPEMDFKLGRFFLINKPTDQQIQNKENLQNRLEQLPKKEGEKLCLELSRTLQMVKGESKQPLRERGLSTLLLVNDVYPEQIEKQTNVEKMLEVIIKIREYAKDKLENIDKIDLRKFVSNELNKEIDLIKKTEVSSEALLKARESFGVLKESINNLSEKSWDESCLTALETIDNLIKNITFESKEQSIVIEEKQDLPEDLFNIPFVGSNNFNYESLENKDQQFGELINELNGFKELFDPKKLQEIKNQLLKLEVRFEKKLEELSENDDETIKMLQWRFDKLDYNIQMITAQEKNRENDLSTKELKKIYDYSSHILKNLCFSTLNNIDISSGNGGKTYETFKSNKDKFYVNVKGAKNILNPKNHSDTKEELSLIAQSISFAEIEKWDHNSENYKKFINLKNAIDNYIKNQPQMHTQSKINIIANYFLFSQISCEHKLLEIEKEIEDNKKLIAASENAIKNLNLDHQKFWGEELPIIENNNHNVNIVVPKKSEPVKDIKKTLPKTKEVSFESEINKLVLPNIVTVTLGQQQLLHIAEGMIKAYSPEKVAKEECAKIYWEQINDTPFSDQETDLKQRVLSELATLLKESKRENIEELNHAELNYYRLVAISRALHSGK